MFSILKADIPGAKANLLARRDLDMGPACKQEYQGDPDNRQEVRAWRVAHAQAAQEVAAAQKAWERQKKAAAKAAKHKAAQVRLPF